MQDANGNFNEQQWLGVAGGTPLAKRGDLEPVRQAGAYLRRVAMLLVVLALAGCVFAVLPYAGIVTDAQDLRIIVFGAAIVQFSLTVAVIHGIDMAGKRLEPAYDP